MPRIADVRFKVGDPVWTFWEGRLREDILSKMLLHDLDDDGVEEYLLGYYVERKDVLGKNEFVPHSCVFHRPSERNEVIEEIQREIQSLRWEIEELRREPASNPTE